ncbi:hypothetical protein LP414_22375 [Polaromonas sp. P1(28)-13]|nr:hypothetical protein LP414_22375 [Polaromonas sp. P1(28)-13]
MFAKGALRLGFAHFAQRSYANTKSKQKKGDPAVWVPSLRYGQPALPEKNGGPHKLGYRLKQRSGPDPVFLRHHRPRQNGTGGDESPNSQTVKQPRHPGFSHECYEFNSFLRTAYLRKKHF